MMMAMRMQKEEKIVVILLFMALGSLAAAFWAFSPEEGNAPGGSASLDGSRSSLITLEGRIISAENTRTGGNLILKLDSTAMPVFIPASAGAKELSARLRTGGRVRVTGTITSYQGEDELKVSRKADILLLEG
ncbi:MAG: hypothetical protein WAV83_03245 [Methanothrix sp.]|jgi:DNA/RNA endonuclease YhcR with UshA esterase domain|uniref:hypothetical protein n=2 Tax=Methanothrix sp. TaxID=90426 RepID=UPI002B615845|nr:hypothetical protein [Methanothrix sp.]MDI9418524.1 hypothetical protein [Euryarchaeota archaeon]HRU74806.1 hypothetical protein [Methanothrix sp.]